jgi:hypothetical protein
MKRMGLSQNSPQQSERKPIPSQAEAGMKRLGINKPNAQQQQPQQQQQQDPQQPQQSGAMSPAADKIVQFATRHPNFIDSIIKMISSVQESKRYSLNALLEQKQGFAPEQLQAAWEKMGSPTDSGAIVGLLRKAGLNDEQIASVFDTINVGMHDKSADKRSVAGPRGTEKQAALPDNVQKSLQVLISKLKPNDKNALVQKLNDIKQEQGV